MPLPSRDLAQQAVVAPAPDGDRDGLRERALAVLLDLSLAHIVALVCWTDGGDLLVADARGRVAIGPDGSTAVRSGRNPIADQDRFSDSTTAYPYAAERLRSTFADPRAPDLVVVHTGAHMWRERGGHPGEHGSLNGVQSRAPLVLSGVGVTGRGLLAEVCRTVDVGATLAHLAGGATDEMDGTPLTQADPGATHVVGLLWDGAQCADLLDRVAAGELPNVARLLERGCAFTGGAIAEFPSVTLVNHTSALTGVGPGRHGIVHNAFYDRESGEQVVPNSSAGWAHAMQWLRPGVRTLWERLPEGTTSACVNEPCDRGAGYSTFARLRDSGAGGAAAMAAALPVAAEDQQATQEFVAASADYAWGTQVDSLGLQQVLELWQAPTPPQVMWWNTTLTDSGHHAGGPGSAIARASVVDADRRLGVWLDLLAERGLLEQTTIVLTADHGSEAADPACTGDWDEALRAAGVPFRDEAYGYLYLGV